MKKVFTGLIIICLLSLNALSFNNFAYAHPGRTDSYGGHYVRTAGWGYPVGSYHYHSGPYAGYSVDYKGEVPAAFRTTTRSTSSTNTVTAKVNRIYASVPGFQIKVKGQVIDSTYTKYPFLSYKNITYIPLTYEVCNTLGIAINWDSTTGLALNKGISSGFLIAPDYGGYNYSGENKEIAYPKFNIYLNGQWVNNGSITYPFMIYNDVTYMPLTWDNAVSQFGLSYFWEPLNGLSIY